MEKPDFKLFKLHEQYNSHELADGMCECGLVIPSDNREENLKSIQGICLFIASMNSDAELITPFLKDSLILCILSTLPTLPKDISRKVYLQIKPRITKQQQQLEEE